MIGTILDLFTSSGAGAMLGLFGSWLTKREERLNLKLSLENEIALAEIRKNEAILEFNHEVEMADSSHRAVLSEAEISRDIAELGGFIESQKAGMRLYGHKLVDTIRGLMRPLITTYLLILATTLIVTMGELIGGLESLPPEALSEAFEDAITQVLFLTTTAVTWWFGSRPSSQKRL